MFHYIIYASHLRYGFVLFIENINPLTIIKNDNNIIIENIKGDKTLKDTLSNILLHPVRMRIIQALIGGESTAQQIGDALPEVPQATLYRHLSKLLSAGAIAVREERQVRGAVEKVYGLPNDLDDNVSSEMETAPKESQFKFIFMYMMNLLGEFERYIGQETINMKEDGLGFRRASVYATNEEYGEYVQTCSEAMHMLLENKPAPGRTLRTIASMAIPQAKQGK